MFYLDVMFTYSVFIKINIYILERFYIGLSEQLLHKFTAPNEKFA